MKTWRDETSGVVHSAFYNMNLGSEFDNKWTSGCWILIEGAAKGGIDLVHRRPITCMTCWRWAS